MKRAIETGCLMAVEPPKGAICERCRRAFPAGELIFDHPWFGYLCTETCGWSTPAMLEKSRAELAKRAVSPKHAAPSPAIRTPIKRVPAPVPVGGMTEILREEIEKACRKSAL